MKLKDIFESYSNRNLKKSDLAFTISEKLRNKILLYCKKFLINDEQGQNYWHDFWSEIRQMLQFHQGKIQLVENVYSQSEIEDTIKFLLCCKDEEFLSFIEYIFKVKCLFHITRDENLLIHEINDIFKSENLGYELTEMVKEEVIEPSHDYPFLGRNVTIVKTVSYPMIIKKDNTVSYSLLTQPALKLLSQKEYKYANCEYLEALDDYKKGDYGDCLTKCCSAFESVMKIICNKKRWAYKQTDTANSLLNTIIQNTSLDSFFKDPLLIIATLRNRLSKSHGAGVIHINTPEHLARYALNSTASAIILLTDITK